MALTGKTIGQLTYLSGATSDTLFPVEFNGDTYHVPFSGMTGNLGSSGTSGSSGSSGTSGSSGSSGTSGSSGSSGTSGSSGSSGTSGTSAVISGSANQILTSNGSGSTTALSGLTYDSTKLSLLYQAGDEGGELFYNKPVTNTTLSGGVTTDVYQNRFRIFEQEGTQRGVYIDISQAPIGVNGEITYKASGIVNAGTFVQLDNIKATVTTSGNRGLSLATVTGSFSYNIGGNFAGGAVGSGGTSLANQTLTTTPTTSIFGWGFLAQGETSTYIITNISSLLTYRITLQVGGSFLNNFISIERLY